MDYRVRRPRATAAGGTEVTSFLLIALGVVVFSQVTRVIFPIWFAIDWDFPVVATLVLAVVAAPVLLHALVVMATQRAALLAGAGSMAAVLVVLRVAEPIPSWLAIAGVGVALVGATGLADRLPVARPMSTSVIAAAVITGLGLDTAVKGAFRSWDLAWQTNAISLLVVLVLAGGLGFVAFVASRQSGASAVPFGGLVPPAGWIALGAFAMLHLLFLHNVGFVASQAEISFGAAVAVVLGGDVVSLLVVGRVARLAGATRLIGGLVAIAAAWALTAVVGTGAAILVVALQVLVGGGIALTLTERDPPSTPDLRRATAAIVGGGIVYLALVLAWLVYLDRDVPLPRQAVPAIAAAAVAGVAWTRRTTPHRDRSTVASVAALGIAALAVVVPVGLWVAQPSAEETVAADTFRIVNYNIRGSVDVDGQVRPDLIAREILSSDPDVVVLQEVGRGWPIHATTDLLTYLQWELEMDYVFEPSADQQYGNVIFSRLPMVEVASGFLPDDGPQDRSYILVAVEVGGGELAIAGTHLHSGSVVQGAAFIDAVGSSPQLVIAGDMNFGPNDPEAALFVDAGFIDSVGASGDPCRTTLREPRSGCDRPDWVLVSDQLSVVDVQIGTGGASDHLAQHVEVGVGN